MNKVVVVGCTGSDDVSTIRRLSADRDVVAVVFDLGEGPGLRELHDQARAAGAVRCHVLDVRDDFLRACVLPEIHALADESGFRRRASDFVEKKLAQIAELEGTSVTRMKNAELGTQNEERLPRRRSREIRGERRREELRTKNVLGDTARIAISFDAGVPVAINDVPLSLTEVVDCLTTLSAVHGIARPRAALHLLRAAYRRLKRVDQKATGVARVELFQGRMRVHEPELATT